jgi:hypothetical protein
MIKGKGFSSSRHLRNVLEHKRGNHYLPFRPILTKLDKANPTLDQL